MNFMNIFKIKYKKLSNINGLVFRLVSYVMFAYDL